MTRLLFLFLLLLAPCTMQAQTTIKYGTIHYDSLLVGLPQYAQVQQRMEELHKKYESETAYNEQNFKRLFAEFLQGQKDFPQTIMQKRQAELQSLMENGISFRIESQKTLEQAEKDLMAEVKKKLNNVILEVGVEYGYAFVLNIDDDACPFINPVIGVDVTDLVRWKLGLLPEPPVGAMPVTAPQGEGIPATENVPTEQPAVPTDQPAVPAEQQVVQPVQEQTQP